MGFLEDVGSQAGSLLGRGAGKLISTFLPFRKGMTVPGQQAVMLRKGGFVDVVKKTKKAKGSKKGKGKKK